MRCQESLDNLCSGEERSEAQMRKGIWADDQTKKRLDVKTTMHVQMFESRAARVVGLPPGFKKCGTFRHIKPRRPNSKCEVGTKDTLRTRLIKNTSMKKNTKLVIFMLI